MQWNVGDWVIFDLAIGQIKELRENGGALFSDGTFETSGMLVERFRPLTLRNKSIVEYFDWYYEQIRKIDGEAGFNYPEISRYFSHLALTAIDRTDEEREPYNSAQLFLKEAQEYQPIIQGIRLFRRKVG